MSSSYRYTLEECERRAEEARERAQFHRAALPALNGDHYAMREWVMDRANERASRWERRAAALRAQQEEK